MGSNDTDQNIRLMLVDIVENGVFPDESFEVRHIERIDNFKITPEGKICFWITRHPHLFGRVSKGRASGGFIPKHYLYELDPELKQVRLIKKEKGEPVINYACLAGEEFEYFDPYSDYDNVLEKLDSEKDVVSFAEKEFHNFSWLDCYETDEDLPEDFQERILAELKKEFISGAVTSWQVLREEK